MTIHPIILSGGAGTRLWPLSRAMYPKQFIPFAQNDGQSFLAAVLRRLPPDEAIAAPTVVCNSDHRFLVRAECEAAGAAAARIVLEPAARNTAAAIAAAAYLTADEPDAILCVMPSDHLIEDAAGFRAAVGNAAKVAAEGRLVLFGVTPQDANTGYGYIEAGAPVGGGPALEVARFTEKPDAAAAAGYLRSGRHFWNSGIFVMHAATFLSELERLQPDIAAASAAAAGKATTDLGFVRLDPESFSKSPAISVDYAVMEKTDKAAMIPLAIAWSDVGSWQALWDISQKDEAGNAGAGAALFHDTRNSYVHSERALVATLGVDDLVIVNTPDALLVADRERAQEVGGIVKLLREQARREHEQHLRNHRPWGFFETLCLSPRFQVKLLHVKPGGQLSMQMHHHRSEHWIVVTGTAKVTVGDKVSLVRENEGLYISATEWHRLENPGKLPLELIEVQIGGYLGEDDIVRSNDVYNRSAEETK